MTGNTQGSALLMAMFVLALLAGAGVSLLFLSQTGLQMARTDLHGKIAFYLAEAGEEDGRGTLFDTNGSGPLSDDLENAAGADGKLDFSAGNILALYDPNGDLTGFTGYGDDVPLRPLTAFGEGWYITFLTNDPVDGRLSKTDSNDRVVITSIGAGPDRSLSVVEAIIESGNILPTIPPATITLLGPLPDFDGGRSKVKRYLGDDCDGSGVPGLYVPVVGTIGSVAEVSAETGIHKNPTYSSGSYTNEDTFADLTDPFEPTVVGSGFGTIDPRWTDCRFLREMANDVRDVADVVCVEGSSCTLPPSSPGRIVFAEGDFVIGPTDSGAGMLFVTGALSFHGRASWNGMVFVVGEGRMTRNGGGNGSISGATLVADIAGPDDVFGTADDCTGADAGFAEVVYEENGGGNSDTVYCTNDLAAANPPRPYDIVSFRQR